MRDEVRGRRAVQNLAVSFIDGGVADFEQGPEECGPGFTEPGVPGQDEAILEAGPGKVLSLERFEFHGLFLLWSNTEGITDRESRNVTYAAREERGPD